MICLQFSDSHSYILLSPGSLCSLNPAGQQLWICTPARKYHTSELDAGWAMQLAFIPTMHCLNDLIQHKRENVSNQCVYIRGLQQTSSAVHCSPLSQIQWESSVRPCGCHQARLGSLIGKLRYNQTFSFPDCCNDAYLLSNSVSITPGLILDGTLTGWMMTCHKWIPHLKWNLWEVCSKEDHCDLEEGLPVWWNYPNSAE